jgi:hypothetical protein
VSAGIHYYGMFFYEDETCEMRVDYRYMGIERQRFHLYGSHQKITDHFGWLHINRIEQRSSDIAVDLSIKDVETITFEYFRIPQAPHFAHPADMLAHIQLAGNAYWNKHFDVFVVLHPFIDEIIAGLHYIFEHPSEYEELPDEQNVRQIEDLLRMLDKVKFSTVQKQE